MVKMPLHSMREDNYVIQIDKAIYQIQPSQAILHQPLKSSWSIAQLEQHAATLKKPRLPTVNTVYCLEDLSILICQNPDLKTRQEK